MFTDKRVFEKHRQEMINAELRSMGITVSGWNIPDYSSIKL